MSRIFDWNHDLSARDIQALERLNLPLEKQTLRSNPRSASEIHDDGVDARICSRKDGLVILEVDLAVYDGALGIFSCGCASTDGMMRGGAAGSCISAALLRQAVAFILQDHAGPAREQCLFPELFA